MRYANDIVKLNKFGFSINSLRLKNKHFIPENLDEYSIFGEKVYSPCSGEVYHVDDGYKDMPASTKKHYSDTGNGIVIKHNNIYVMMWHLKQNSITVKVGEQVKEGQLIGQVGNSGHSSTPHLHIQASKEDWLHGTSVPILFDRKFPVRHSIYIR
ncbi:MAG: M23 family metallopeptidase [Clostridia bacterium]|nr:M23 family metallopeptidase [Clostridia bacterium]